MKLIRSIDLEHSTVSFLEPDFVRIDIREGTTITGKETAEMTKAIGELGEGKEMRVIILADELTQFEKSAREYSASPAGNIYTRADALVVKNLAQRMIANFYIKFDKPIKPSKVFNSESEAVKWLKGIG